MCFWAPMVEILRSVVLEGVVVVCWYSEFEFLN